MADLFKDAKRGQPLPRIVGGYTYCGERYAEHTDEPRGVMPPMLFTLNIHSQRIGTKDAECYEVRLTEEEALRTCAEWMKLLASRRARAEKDARDAANRAKDGASLNAAH